MAIDRFIEKVCVQTAVLWSYTGKDGFGKSVYDAPVEIKVRWQGSEEVLFDENGRQFTSKAEILLTQDIKMLDCLYLGTLDEISSESNPDNIEEAYSVKKFTKVPMIFSTEIFVRKAFV